MPKLNRNLPPVKVDQFSMVPRGDVPRSTFRTQHTHKTTFNFDYLVPIHVDEVLPGDVHRGSMTVFARLATLLFPLMDNVYCESFFFFVPSRILWSNWKKFMGEQANPADSISFTIPQCSGPTGGWTVGSIGDFFGLAVAGQCAPGVNPNSNALPMRAYNLIYNEWFRDQNLVNSLQVPLTDGPDVNTLYNTKRRMKKHDYFTSALPWPLKGGVDVALPLAGQARINVDTTIDTEAVAVWNTIVGAYRNFQAPGPAFPSFLVAANSAAASTERLYADLTTATQTTINAMRLAVATQQFLERDARGGTRYTEILRNHFGVTPEDQRLQRPEYIGGGRSAVQTQAIPQTSASNLSGGTTPAGSLTGTAVIAGRHEFSYHAQEHGYIIGLVNVCADLTWQQGLHRMWTRSTRYDFYWPAFAHLGEQAVRTDEIYVRGDAGDTVVFGYQERWSEYRHRPSRISGLFRGTSAGTIDTWHLAQEYSPAPVLNETFMQADTPFTRVSAAGASDNNKHVLFDSVFNIACTRAIPVYSVPGLDRF